MQLRERKGETSNSCVPGLEICPDNLVYCFLIITWVCSLTRKYKVETNKYYPKLLFYAPELLLLIRNNQIKVNQLIVESVFLISLCGNSYVPSPVFSFDQAIFIFGFGVPLFLDMEIADRGKWGVWCTNKLLLTAAYGYILFVHFSKWRDKLPPRPAFYNYVIVMFVTTAVMLFACGLAGISGGFGLWLYNLTVVCYHSLYLPFLYVTFLADFFKEEDWLLDSAYYSEMKDAGFFDADWE
ncbi:hypothetical protein H5410_033626 [Solanum commersonii]|uniref:Uncharacterized protein n=1 Tax=Solanum commersonii TaxID=4109 RepID=A0A9J5YRC7_SOLCO|nr:hypothetical protein H5410_033626 [Solanum commersonii]